MAPSLGGHDRLGERRLQNDHRSRDFSGNSAPSGGVFSFVGSDHTTGLTVVDSVFVGNTATGDGAVLDASKTPTTTKVSFVNSSFWGNVASGGAGTGTLSGDGSTILALTNTILYDAANAQEISSKHPFKTQSVQSSDVAQTGFAGANGNISADPVYVNAASGDLRIGATSPCAGAGASTGAPASDFLQHPWGARVSIGAYAPYATHFSVSAPPQVEAGQPFSVKVSALDVTSSPVTTYDGKVHFTSSDTHAVLPADGPLGDGGAFQATLLTPGSVTISVNDTVDTSFVGTSAPIQVGAADAGTNPPDAATDGSDGSDAAVGPAISPDGSEGCGCTTAGHGVAGGGVLPFAAFCVWLARRRRRS